MSEILARLELAIHCFPADPAFITQLFKDAKREIEHLCSLAGSVSEGKDFRAIKDELDHG